MQSQADFERIDSPSMAIQAAMESLNASGFSVDLRSVGENISTTECLLRREDGRHSRGRGKGIGDQSLASAMFEAVEHFFYEHEDKTAISEEMRFDPVDTRHHGHYHLSSPDLSRFIRSEYAPLSCLTFEGLNEAGSISYPAILTDPKFIPPTKAEADWIEESGLYRYSSNSGTASGRSRSEALLHGVLEVIERDAVSLLLVRSVLRREAYPMRRIAQESLPAHIQALIHVASAECGGEISVWDITSDVELPAALCQLAIGELRFYGSGASLFAGYALERAILEAVQVFHIQKHFGPWLQIKRRVDIEAMSLMQRCNLEGGHFFPRGGEVITEFNPKSSEVEKTGIEQQIQLICSALKKRGIGVFAREIASEGFNVHQVIAPRLERCFLLSHGLPVAPSHRGKVAAN